MCLFILGGRNTKTFLNILYTGNEISDLPRIPDTVSEYAVNFCVLDRENRTTSVIRMGAYINDKFEKRIAEKFKY